MQDEAALECGPEFQEELLVLQSIYDSELQMKRNAEGGISLQLKLCPSPPTYIRASVTVHIPTAVRAPALPVSKYKIVCDLYNLTRSTGSILNCSVCRM